MKDRASRLERIAWGIEAAGWEQTGSQQQQQQHDGWWFACKRVIVRYLSFHRTQPVLAYGTIARTSRRRRVAAPCTLAAVLGFDASRGPHPTPTHGVGLGFFPI